MTNQTESNIKIKWIDVQEIALQLHEKFPDIDPLSIRFTDLHRWICEITGFDDDPNHSNEKILETIQELWIKEL